MTPTFRIVADGADITSLTNDRLLLLRTADKPGLESDDFELRIDDRDSAVSLPSRGASIEIFLGYIGTALTRLGRYTVDEVELSGPPDTLVIRGKASDMSGSGKTTRNPTGQAIRLHRQSGRRPVTGHASPSGAERKRQALGRSHIDPQRRKPLAVSFSRSQRPQSRDEQTSGSKHRPVAHHHPQQRRRT